LLYAVGVDIDLTFVFFL